MEACRYTNLDWVAIFGPAEPSPLALRKRFIVLWAHGDLCLHIVFSVGSISFIIGESTFLWEFCFIFFYKRSELLLVIGSDNNLL